MPGNIDSIVASPSRARPATVCLATWDGAIPFDPARFSPAERAAVIALLQRTDVVAVGNLAAPGPALDALLREAGPQYHYLCPPSEQPGQPRPGVLYDATRLSLNGVVDLAQMPGWTGPRPYLTELGLGPAATRTATHGP